MHIFYSTYLGNLLPIGVGILYCVLQNSFLRTLWCLEELDLGHNDIALRVGPHLVKTCFGIRLMMVSNRNWLAVTGLRQSVVQVRCRRPQDLPINVLR